MLKSAAAVATPPLHTLQHCSIGLQKSTKELKNHAAKKKNQLSAYKSMICNPAITMQNAVPRHPLHPHAATRSTAPLENSSSNADQRSLSCATSDQRPLPCIKFTRTSSHRAIGLPGARNPPTGCQSSIHVVHLRRLEECRGTCEGCGLRSDVPALTP